MHVKICGIRTLEGARIALEAGADLLGFNFYPPSPRSIEPEACAQILRALRREDDEPYSLPSQERGARIFVGVFVNAPVAHVQAVLDQCGLDLAQLHGDEPPEDLVALGGRAYKAFRPRDPDHLARLLDRYPLPSGITGLAPAALIDAYRPGEYGGTGVQADWSLAASLCAESTVLLAGGLTPENVAGAIRQVSPWGVDVASGVESAPGCQDPQKIRAFVHAVKEMI